MGKKNIEIEKICAMCEMSQKIFDEDNVLCRRKGVVSAVGKCKKFSYDVLKRIPPKTPSISPLDYVDIDADDLNEKTENSQTSEVQN